MTLRSLPSSTGGVAPVQWDSAHMSSSLLHCSMSSLMKRSTAEPPHSPLFQYVQSQRQVMPAARDSPALSLASEDSLDSLLTATSANNSVTDEAAAPAMTEEEAETNELIYRLCRSLFKKALQKTEGGRGSVNRSTQVSVDSTHERNMSRVMDWMPLLHLFDPKSFYAYRENTAFTSVANVGIHSVELPVSLQRAENPREASRRLVDELEVEKLSGGNSNHVYRLGHPQFPDKTILLRVYGGGDDEAIDRYRDVAAMKQMSVAQLAPAVLHSFRWGRVEEFMENVATGTTDMLIDSPSLLKEVYEVLHEMHQLPVDPFLPEAANKARFKRNALLAAPLREVYDGPGDYLARNAQRLKEALTHSDKEGYYATETEAKIMEEICPTVFERASLRFLRLTSPSIQPAFRKDFVRFITGEVMYVRERLQRLSTPVVFSHNDLNPANILLSWRKVPRRHRTATPTTTVSRRGTDSAAATSDDDEADEVTSTVSERSSLISRKFLTKKGHHKNLVELKGMVFIDFEYSDANYRAIDLGNTICELDYDYTRGTESGGPGFIKYLHVFPPAGFEAAWADMPEYYPRLPEIIYEAWQRAQTRSSSSSSSSSDATDIGASCLQAVSAYFQLEEAGAREAAPALVTQEQLTEVFLGMLATQLHWCLWSFTLACNSDTLTNQTAVDDTFAKGSSGLDYVRYGDCRLKEYLCLKQWMAERHLI